MQIRTRLTLQFLLIGGVIILIASFAIYFSSANYRKTTFYESLENKAINTAKLLLEVDEIGLDLLKKIEKNNTVNLYNEKIIILNNLNEVLFSSDYKNEIFLNNNFINRIRSNTKSTFSYHNYDILGLKYQIQGEQFIFIAAATDIEGFLKLKNLIFILIVVDLLCLILFFIAGWINSERALKPMSNVLSRVEEISISSLNLRVPEGNGTDEIAKLAKTFNKMLSRLEQSFLVQKDFISNASHELRTPLTSIKGQIDVLLMKERTGMDYKVAMESVLEDITSLITLSNQLLMIARTSTENLDNLNNAVRIDEVIWQARDEIKKYNKDYHININISESLTEIDQMIVKGDEYLLKTAVSNIIDNACKYSDNHSVNVTLKSTDSSIILIFEDSGIGIIAGEISKIFDPFYRGSNAITYPGSGIGLQLTNQIIQNHGGKISVSSKLNQGTTFTVSLPSVA